MSFKERYLKSVDPEERKLLFKQHLDTVPCIMYQRFTYCYIERLMIMKELIIEDIYQLILKYLIKITKYPKEYLCLKKSTSTVWGDLSIGLCSGTCTSAYYEYPSNYHYFYPFPKSNKKLHKI